MVTATFGDTKGAVDFLTRMQTRNADDQRWLPFLSTHPHTTERIARVRKNFAE